MRLVYTMFALMMCAVFFKFFIPDASVDAKLLSTAIVVGGMLAGVHEE